MHKILQNHLLCAFVANLKIDAIYAESFFDKNLAIRKVFAFCDSADLTHLAWVVDEELDILIILPFCLSFESLKPTPQRLGR